MAKNKKGYNSDMFKELNELVELQKELSKKGERLLTACFKKLFESHPNLIQFSWTQYAPGFNDGDPCEFSVHADFYNELAVDTEDGDDEDFYDYDLVYSDKMKTEEKDSLEASLSTLSEILQSLEDSLKTIFGSSHKITVTPKDIKVEDYDCGY